MNRLVMIGLLLVVCGTALACHGDDRTSRASLENVGESRAPASGREVVSSTRTELDASNRVRPIYAAVLSSIADDLETRIAESGDSRITVDLPPLPDNLYGDRYSGWVIFGDVMVWTLEVFVPRPANLQFPPTLTIRFDDPADLEEGPRLILSLDTSNREVAIIATNGLAPSVGPIPGVIPEENPDAAIAQLTRSIIEGQLQSLGPAFPTSTR